MKAGILLLMKLIAIKVGFGLKKWIRQSKQDQISENIDIILDSHWRCPILLIELRRMSKKTRSNQCKGRWCETHLFQFRPRLVLSDSSFEETIRFCPRFNREQKRLENIRPVINLDGRCYTPLFILQQDKVLYSSHDLSSRRAFEENQMQQQMQISQIVNPFPPNSLDLIQMKPRLTNAYCKICKLSFEDYQQHQESLSHRQLVAAHPYSTFITQLARDFKLQQQNLNEFHPELASFQALDSEMECALHEKETAHREKQIVIDPLQSR